MRVLGKAPTSGFFHDKGETDAISPHSHPISYKQIGHSIWTRHQYKIRSLESPDLLPGHIIHNTLCNPWSNVLHLGSEGSVCLADEVATCAWMVMDTDSTSMQACFLLWNTNSFTSYRNELKGIYCGLHHIQFLNLKPVEIQQCMGILPPGDNCADHGSCATPGQTPPTVTRRKDSLHTHTIPI